MVTPGAGSAIRRFAGPEATELAILCRPEYGSPDPTHQAEATYRSLAALLDAEGSSFDDLVGETLYLRDVQRDLPPILDVRNRVLAALGQGDRAAQPVCIQQPPLDQAATLELAAAAVVPHDRGTWSVRDVSSPGPATARVVRLGDQTSLHTAQVYGAGATVFEQASTMFRAGDDLLRQCGMAFRDVVRTWIFLRNIDRDYGAFNEARRAFYGSRGVERLPASTGVQGGPPSGEHDCSLHLVAIRSAAGLDVRPMSTPTLNEAWTYGADFSRGLRVADANAVTLHLSGTASIDETGRTVHVGDIAAQVDRMLHNIETLLARQGATVDDLVSGVTYLKRPADAPLLRAMYHDRGFDRFPGALVEAPLCRPELLCEMEAVAKLPLGRAAG
jgi:enamine deaminase RidA (YjgF/YER057c/UK114 family)